MTTPAPPGSEPMRSCHFVVGVDGSPGSAAALDWCARVAPKLDALVIAVHVVTPLVYTVPTRVALDVPILDEDQVRSKLAAELESWCDPLRRAGAAYRTEVLEGRVAETLLRAADEHHADLVIFGRRGRGGVAERLLGSVASQLAHHCTRPVMVVPLQPPAPELTAPT